MPRQSLVSRFFLVFIVFNLLVSLLVIFLQALVSCTINSYINTVVHGTHFLVLSWKTFTVLNLDRNYTSLAFIGWGNWFLAVKIWIRVRCTFCNWINFACCSCASLYSCILTNFSKLNRALTLTWREILFFYNTSIEIIGILPMGVLQVLRVDHMNLW